MIGGAIIVLLIVIVGVEIYGSIRDHSADE